MRLVIDTNIFISAVLGSDDGACREVLARCLQRAYEPVMSAALYAEYIAVSNRQDLMRGRKISTEKQDILLDAFLSVCQWQSVYFT